MARVSRHKIERAAKRIAASLGSNGGFDPERMTPWFAAWCLDLAKKDIAPSDTWYSSKSVLWRGTKKWSELNSWEAISQELSPKGVDALLTVAEGTGPQKVNSWLVARYVNLVRSYMGGYSKKEDFVRAHH